MFFIILNDLGEYSGRYRSS